MRPWPAESPEGCPGWARCRTGSFACSEMPTATARWTRPTGLPSFAPWVRGGEWPTTAHTLTSMGMVELTESMTADRLVLGPGFRVQRTEVVIAGRPQALQSQVVRVRARRPFADGQRLLQTAQRFSAVAPLRLQDAQVRLRVGQVDLMGDGIGI